MTPEHEEAVRLAEKHGGTFGHGATKLYIFDQPKLAALIAEVRRQAMEEAAQACESVSHGGSFAFAIRARMEEV